jgi:hypothetical protein
VLIDENGCPLGEVFDRALPDDPAALLLGNPLHVGSVVVRREWQERVGWFDESLRSYEDWDMWLRLAKSGCPMAWVPHPVSLYRFHRAQMTRIGAQMTSATFAVLDKTFQDPSLPDSWKARRDEAYGRAFLRAAAQAYTAGDFPAAERSMSEAARLCPHLCGDRAEPLARLIAGWANHVKTGEPLVFLASIYDHLPEELSVLRGRRRQDLAREALQLAFDAYRRGDGAAARSRVRQAVGYRPQALFDRGVLSLLLKSGMPGSATSTNTEASSRHSWTGRGGAPCEGKP